MRRYALLSIIAAVSTCSIATGQSDEPDFRAIQVFQVPENYFSVGFRLSGRLKAKFKNLGTVASANDAGDTTSEYNRSYDDGYVGRDTRTTDGGSDLYDDGRTNTWSYTYADQVTADQGSIAYHSYSSKTDGNGIDAESGTSLGLDLEYARRLGRSASQGGQEPRWSWGVLAGIGMSGVNAKTGGEISATLLTLTDTYSLLGATPPAAGYSGPSTTTETITNPDGTTTTVTVDTTTYLANRPDSRTETSEAGAAIIEGFWQARGAFISARAGPWFRWQPKPRFSIRASAGVSATWLGLQMRYDERLKISRIATNKIISASDQSKYDTWTVPGAFGTIDFEWWMSRRTAIFVSGMYEYYAKDIDLGFSGRSAAIELTGGPAIRIGVTTRF